MASHLVAFYAATAGLNGASLGCDEEDIVLIQYLIWDIRESKVLTEQQYIVKPNGADVNENILGETCREEYGLTEEQVKGGQSMESVIDSFDAIVSKLCDDGCKLNLLTDGQLHLRQVLHPKAVSKGIELPLFYHNFFDIRKEFKSFYHAAGDVFSIKDMTEYLDIKCDCDCNLAVRSVREMINIAERMVREGHRFAIPEVINIRLEPGICTRNEEVDNGCVVRARGLPWQSSDQDIAKFFRGLNIAKGGVALCLSPQGRRNGEALVRFVAAEHRDMALKRHKHHIGNRYIEVYKATGEDFINVAGGNNNEAQQFLSKGGQVIIRMRGLPYDCAAKQVVEFFEAGENGCEILDGEDGVLFVRKPDGRATGDAFVLFAREEDSTKALAKHREIIGSRYIELFRSTTAEVQQVLNRSMDPRTFEQQQPLIGQLPQMPMLPQQFITASNRRDCIRLRGLPYEAQVEHVLEFLGEHAKSIVFRGVHMVINAQGQPSGEAFIQMDGEQSAFLAAQNRHHRYMVFGKKQRYVEVFQCSGEDMNVVLSGAIPPPQRTVVSPGMFIWDQSTALSSPPLTTPPPQPQSSMLPPGAAAAAQRQFSIPGTMLPPQYQQASAVPTPNGTFMSSMLAAQMKPEHMMLTNGPIPTHLRPPTMLQQSQLEMPRVSQASMVSTMKPGAMSPQARALHQAMLAQYGSLGLTNQPPIAVSSASPGMFLFPGAKMPGADYSHAFQPQMTFVTMSSAMDTRHLQSFQPKYTLATHPLLTVPYATSANMIPFGAQGGLRTQMSINPSGAKRSFEQAFTGSDKNSVMRQIKRPPPKFTSPIPRINPSHLQPPQMATHSLGQPTAVPQQTLSAMTMPATMIPAMYPPPQLYPPTM